MFPDAVGIYTAQTTHIEGQGYDQQAAEDAWWTTETTLDKLEHDTCAVVYWLLQSIASSYYTGIRPQPGITMVVRT